MAKLKAAVLAAGRGVRMGGTKPKTLIPVRAYQPLLYYILNGLKKAGVEDLVVVTGHGSAEVEAYVGENWDGASQFVFNARFASWGNFHSVRMALDQSPGADLLVVNADVVVHPDVLVETRRGAGDLVIAVEPRPNLDEEDMRVRLNGQRVLAIGKNLRKAHGHAEFIGVSLIRPDAARIYLDLATTAEWTADTDLYYEDVYARMIGAVDVTAVSVPRGRYAEVDEWVDMEAAAGILRANEDAWDKPRAATTAGAQ